MKKPYRIAFAILVTVFIGFLNVSNLVQRNSIDYQTNPIASILGAIIVSPLAGLIFYWLSGISTSRAEKANKAPPSNESTQTDQDDNHFYDQVAGELQNNILIPGLWTKAYAEASGDESKARAFYIKYRVTQLAIGSRPQESKPPVKAEEYPNDEQKKPAAFFQDQVLLTVT